MSVPNNEGLSLFLASKGIEAKRIPVDGWDALGYFEYVTFDNGLPKYDSLGRIMREFKEWDSPETFEEVKRLFAGGETKKVAPAKTTELREDTPEPAPHPLPPKKKADK